MEKMKTYREFYEVLYHEKLITGRLEELAAKEYAKQWIEVAYKNTFMPKLYAEQLKKEIDEQS